MTGPVHQKATAEQAELLHRFAHDLRNRLIGMQQAMGQFDDASAEQRSELLDFAQKQYFRAMRSTEEMLDAFGVDRGVGALSLAPVDLAALLRAGVAELQHKLDRKSQHAQIDMPDRIPVNGDAHWLKELILALLGNAIKFGAPGGSIRISLHPDAGSAVFTVTDDGTGLDQEDLANVFVRYAWLKNRPTAGESQGRSTLARAQQWAEAHNGQLTAASEGPGKGCTFTLRLPLAQ